MLPIVKLNGLEAVPAAPFLTTTLKVPAASTAWPLIALLVIAPRPTGAIGQPAVQPGPVKTTVALAGSKFKPDIVKPKGWPSMGKVGDVEIPFKVGTSVI